MQDFYDAIKHLAGGQVYAVIAPQDAQYPTVVYSPLDTAHVMALDGPNALRRSRVQVDVYARTLQSCEQVHTQVRLALHDTLHTLVDVRMGLTDFDPQAGIYRMSVDFTYYR